MFTVDGPDHNLYPNTVYPDASNAVTVPNASPADLAIAEQQYSDDLAACRIADLAPVVDAASPAWLSPDTVIFGQTGDQPKNLDSSRSEDHPVTVDEDADVGSGPGVAGGNNSGDGDHGSGKDGGISRENSPD